MNWKYWHSHFGCTHPPLCIRCTWCGYRANPLKYYPIAILQILAFKCLDLLAWMEKWDQRFASNQR